MYWESSQKSNNYEIAINVTQKVALFIITRRGNGESSTHYQLYPGHQLASTWIPLNTNWYLNWRFFFKKELTR